jgi:hypothetical protein
MILDLDIFRAAETGYEVVTIMAIFWPQEPFGGSSKA